MEQSLRSHGQGRPDQGSSPSSDRLRKAIERNRAKRSKKSRPADAALVTPPPSRPSQDAPPPQRQSRGPNVRGGPPRSRRFVQSPQEVEEDFDEEEIDEEDEEDIVQAPLPQRRRPPPQSPNRNPLPTKHNHWDVRIGFFFSLPLSPYLVPKDTTS